MRTVNCYYIYLWFNYNYWKSFRMPLKIVHDRFSIIGHIECVRAILNNILTYPIFWKLLPEDIYILIFNSILEFSLFFIGPIFLRLFRLYVLSFMFRFMFVNICFEKNQNSKIYVMFIINITWNETGICSFWAVWAIRAVEKNQVLTCASLLC